MLMTVIVHDASARLSPVAREELAAGRMECILYAEDTLLAGRDQSRLQEMLDSVAHVGGVPRGDAAAERNRLRFQQLF